MLHIRKCSRLTSVIYTGPTLESCKFTFHLHRLHNNGMLNFSRKSSTEFTEKVDENVKPFSSIPGPPCLPLVGNMLRYRIPGGYKISKRQDSLVDMYDKYGPIVKETICGETIVHLYDPDYIQILYQNEPKMPNIPPLMDTVKKYRESRNMSPGLGNMNGEEWYKLRGAVQQMMMRPKAVTAYLPLVVDVAEDFLNFLIDHRGEDGEVPEFDNKVSLWNLESSAYKCFEKRLGGIVEDKTSESQKMVDSNTALFELSAKLKFSLPLFHKLNTPSWKKLVAAEDYFMNNGKRYLDEALAEIKHLKDEGSLSEDRFIFLTYLLSKKELDYRDIYIITMSLFADGLRTTSPALIFNLYCLAKNPDVQQQAYEEICHILPSDQPITADALNELKYLRGCIKETFRMFPVGLEISRILQKDLVIGGYHLPAGTYIDVNQHVMFSMDKYFDKPHQFLPERWLRDGTAHNINPYILTPFGHGTRMCVGRRFAEQELNVLLAMFLKRFRLEWNHHDLDHKYTILQFPDQPVRLSFRDRC